MQPALADICLHCERRPRETGLGLCAACNSVEGIHRLYVRRRGWTLEWEMHLRRLTERATQQIPLFAPGLPDVTPRRAGHNDTPEERLARLRRHITFPRRLPRHGDDD